MNESKSRTRSSSKEGRPTVTFGAPLSTSEERKLFQAQTYFELSLKNLSSPFPQQDLISADSAEDIFVVQLPTSIVELQKAIMEGSASADEINSARFEVEALVSKRSAKFSEAFSKFREKEKIEADLKMERAVAQAMAQAMTQAMAHFQPSPFSAPATFQPAPSFTSSHSHVVTGGDTSSLRPEIGTCASKLAFEFSGTPRTKQEETLSKLPKVASDELVSEVRNLILADNDLSKSETIENVFKIAAQGIGGNITAHGSVPIDQAIKGGDIPLSVSSRPRLEAGIMGEATSTSVPLSMHRACRTDQEALALANEHLHDLKSGLVPGLVGVLDESTRVLTLTHDFSFIMQSRGLVQLLLADAIVKVLGDDEFTKQLQNASEY